MPEHIKQRTIAVCGTINLEVVKSVLASAIGRLQCYIDANRYRAFLTAPLFLYLISNNYALRFRKIVKNVLFKIFSI